MPANELFELPFATLPRQIRTPYRRQHACVLLRVRPGRPAAVAQPSRRRLRVRAAPRPRHRSAAAAAFARVEQIVRLDISDRPCARASARVPSELRARTTGVEGRSPLRSTPRDRRPPPREPGSYELAAAAAAAPWTRLRPAYLRARVSAPPPPTSARDRRWAAL